MNLLPELLKLVTEENLATPAKLAQRLNISVGLVELMLADLERAGYLRTVTSTCSSCAGCGPQQTCQPPRARLWARTDKPFRRVS
jgi:hypothetical protein